MRASATGLLMVISALVIVCTEAIAADRITSKYTSTAREKSVGYVRDSEDASGFRAKFRGFGSYDLDQVGGDERSWINILYAGKRVDLHEATMEADAEEKARRLADGER